MEENKIPVETAKTLEEIDKEKDFLERAKDELERIQKNDRSIQPTTEPVVEKPKTLEKTYNPSSGFTNFQALAIIAGVVVTIFTIAMLVV